MRMRGRQTSGAEWQRLCERVRGQFVRVCPHSNWWLTNEPGTFLRSEIVERSGVSLTNIRRLMDERLPATPDTIIKIAGFLGMRLVLRRVGNLPTPPPVSEYDAHKFGERSRRTRTRSGTRRRRRTRQTR